MPRAKKRVTGEARDTAGPKKKTKRASSYPDSGVEKIKLKEPPFVGELLFSGGTNWDLIGRSRLPKSSAGKQNVGGRNLWGPHRLAVMSGIRVSCVVSGPMACHSIIITEAGKAMSWGRGDKGQLGHGDVLRCEVPKLIDVLKDFSIVNAACGRNHTMCLTEEGTVYAFGDNKLGQLGIGHQNTPISTPTKLMYSGRPIVKVACGAEFTMLLDYKGTLHSFGCPEYSQLGHNSNGQYFVSSNKTSFDCVLTPRRIGAFIEKTRDGFKFMDNIVIKDVACGANHTVALDMQGRVFTWGFRGYGRLGHNELRDEPVPRLLKNFDPANNRAAKLINAGTSYSMAVTEHAEQLYFWGQTKTTGEATMYPKAVQDLTGWKVKNIGCSNHSIILIADTSVVSYGPAPTFGELCYGENGPRSSIQAKEVKPLENIHVHALTCGLGHTLMIAKDDTVADRRALRALPIFNPTKVPINEPPIEEEEEEEKAPAEPEQVVGNGGTKEPWADPDCPLDLAMPPAVEKDQVAAAVPERQPSIPPSVDDSKAEVPKETLETKAATVAATAAAAASAAAAEAAAEAAIKQMQKLSEPIKPEVITTGTNGDAKNLAEAEVELEAVAKAQVEAEARVEAEAKVEEVKKVEEVVKAEVEMEAEAKVDEATKVEEVSKVEEPEMEMEADAKVEEAAKPEEVAKAEVEMEAEAKVEEVAKPEAEAKAEMETDLEAATEVPLAQTIQEPPKPGMLPPAAAVTVSP